MSMIGSKRARIGRRVKVSLAATVFATAALLGSAGVAEAQAASTTASGTGTVSYNGELTRFSINVTGEGGGSAASGSCSFDGASGTTVRCTSFYDFRVDSANKITTRGTATLNGRPISFTAVLTDEGVGNRDSYTLYTAGRVIGGKLISGDIVISSSGEETTTG